MQPYQPIARGTRTPESAAAFWLWLPYGQPTRSHNMAQIPWGYHDTQGQITGIAIAGALTVTQTKTVARPTGAAPGSLPKVTWKRQIEIDPRVRGFKLHFNEADFR